MVTELDVESLDDFNGKSIAVVGFGKSAVDMAVFTTNHGAKVEHIFRTPRWLLPFKIFGIHYSRLLFSRASTSMMPCWAHASRLERALHRYGNFLTRSFWGMIQTILKLQLKSQARKIGGDAKTHLAKVTPTHPLVPDLSCSLNIV